VKIGGQWHSTKKAVEEYNETGYIRKVATETEAEVASSGDDLTLFR
jgi:hypothetical protein